MKGLFFKNNNGIGFEIISDVMCRRTKEGYDEILVVVKKLDDNLISTINVSWINTVVNSPKYIGY